MMPPRSLSAADSEALRSRYKLVRRNTMDDVLGPILCANVENGLCLLRDAKGERQEFNFGPDGLWIVIR